MININYFKIFLLFVLTWHIGHNRIKSQKTELDDEMDVGQLTFGYCLKNHSFLIVCGLSLEGCLNECAIRKKCKSFNYIKLYLLCELNELDQSDSSLQICHGSAYMDVSSQHSMRPESCTSCGDHEVCQESDCVIEECGELLPSSHGYILGNLHVIGSKRKHVCETGYQLGQYQTETSEIHTCNGDGDWEPEIQECNDIDDCASNPCQHGTCTDLVAGYSCVCLLGYSGVICDENIDECVGVNCGHGQCNDEINGYDCSCETGYEGDHCETNIDDCSSNPCQHGTCTDLVAGYSCVCLPGYSGVNCDENIDDCVGVNCGHGHCNDGINRYDCSCEVGYEGDHCETVSAVCDTMECESRKGNYNSCAAPQAGHIISLSVKEQQSGSPCDSGISFGFSARSIWVNHGCRAIFKVCYSPN